MSEKSVVMELEELIKEKCALAKKTNDPSILINIAKLTESLASLIEVKRGCA